MSMPVFLLFVALTVAAAMLVLAGVIDVLDRIARRGRERRCIRCGCTDAEACAGGCVWLSFDPPICSRCTHDHEIYDDELFA
jgi:hypothetical protein